jgi:DNA/RNA endonuclease YhcR with UshA esterase domain
MLVLALFAVAASSGFTIACGAVNNDDDSGGDTDSDTDTDTDADADTTIYEVQQGEVAEGTIVTLTNVVVTTPVHTEEAAVFVEEMDGGPYSGIHVYMYTEVMAEHYGLQPGDVVNVTGEYTEFYGVSEITVQSPADIVVTGTGDVPGPDVVSPEDVTTGGAQAEAYESVLIKVEDVTVTDPDAGYGEFVIDDSLHINDFFFTEGGGPSGAKITTALDDTFGGITGVLMFSFEEFTLAPRFVEDFEDWNHLETTIYDVQQGLIPENTEVTIENVVVTSPLHEEDSKIFVQETSGGEYSGIVLYLYSEVIDAVDLEVGDMVTFTGVYSEFYDNSEITVESASNIAEIASVTPPVPEVVLPADIANGGDLSESYEGVLVQVEDVTVINPDAGFGMFIVTDDLLVDDFFFTGDGGPSGDMPPVALDDVFTTLTGPLYYSFDEFKMVPRDAADMNFQ